MRPLPSPTVRPPPGTLAEFLDRTRDDIDNRRSKVKNWVQPLTTECTFEPQLDKKVGVFFPSPPHALSTPFPLLCFLILVIMIVCLSGLTGFVIFCYLL
jgi:hypothetical protein